MVFLLLVVMLTACAASPRDQSGKMFTFSEETATATVKLTTSEEEFSAVTLCFKFVTDLRRNHVLFSLSTSTNANAFLVFKPATSDVIEIYVNNKKAVFGGQDYTLNQWHSICTTWDSATGLVQLWFNGMASIKKYLGGPKISKPIIILGQDQDSYGGRFDIAQSFIGMMSDVHMWNHILSPCEIKRYVEDLNFTPGNLINWRALVCETTGRVLTEFKQMGCGKNPMTVSRGP